MNMPNRLLFLSLVTLAMTGAAREIHVSKEGNDSNTGAKRSNALLTIQKAAELAQPGDTVTVHGGIYRERVNPPRGGSSNSKRIIYRAAPGEVVEIRGSEVITGWTKDRGDVWKATVPNSLFGSFNPYTNVIHGDWFNGKGRQHHTGAVYARGHWLYEATSLDQVMAQGASDKQLWFAKVDDHNTTVWAQFPGINPVEQEIEINARQSVFYPAQPGRDFITVRGFRMRHAATPWAPPTAQQVALIGTHWSKGWIIENCVVTHSICSGISLGKHGDEYDNTSADTAEGYVKTIERAYKRGWTRQNIGGHVVRSNEIAHCEQAGIVGSLGAAFCSVTDNTIHDVHARKLFTGAEMAGIKLHAAIDTIIARNHIYRTTLGLWLDWMAQGTRVSGNMFHDNERDLFVEVNHGPFMVDNNFFLSRESLLDVSEGGAFAHNLFKGRIISQPEPNRQTPFHPPHTTEMAGLADTKGGDNRFYNNIFIGTGADAKGFGLSMYDNRQYPLQTGGNVFFNGAQPWKNEAGHVIAPGNLDVRLSHEGKSGTTVSYEATQDFMKANTRVVTTQLLGEASVSKVPYEAPDGTAMKVQHDYNGKKRARIPTPGPLETKQPGVVTATAVGAKR